MGYPFTCISAAPAGDADGYVVSVDMKVGAYTMAATAPTFGARHVTCTRTVVDVADTPGTLTVTGTDPAGQSITETLTPGANGILVTGTKFFKGDVAVTGVGWVQGGAAKDTIVVGWDNVNAVAVGAGTLHAIVVNTTAAGAITIADSSGTIATLKASIAEGTYVYDVQWTSYLRIEPAAASNITVVHSGSTPSY